jgi:hypothetical protein
MSASQKQSGIGADVATSKHGPNVEFFRYLVDRPTPVPGLVSTEAVVDVRMSFAHAVRDVWRIVRDFNLWHHRYGYEWSGVIGEEENNIVYLSNKKNNNFGTRIPYIVRRVIPERLIYQESLPHPFPDNSGFWSGHNVLSLWEEGGGTKMTCFMEHTFFSQRLSSEELRKITADLMFEQGIGFWKEYFIPDLQTLIEGRPIAK